LSFQIQLSNVRVTVANASGRGCTSGERQAAAATTRAAGAARNEILKVRLHG